MTASAYAFSDLPTLPQTEAPAHAGDLIRLIDASPGRFSLVLAGYNRPDYRDRLIRSLPSSLPDAANVLECRDFADLPSLENALETRAADPAPLHLIGLDQWLRCDGADAPGIERLHALNQHREYIARSCRHALVLWLPPHLIRQLAREAPDLWEWRACVLDFDLQTAMKEPELRAPLDTFIADRAQRQERISELQTFIQTHDDVLSDPERRTIWMELGDLLKSIGDWQQALEAYAQAQAICERLDDDRAKALTRGRIADILQARGELDAALKIRTDEELPVYERLGDVRSKAITLVKIADILQARGELDAALKICTDEVLPVFERLGDVRSKAVTLGRIADILQTKGDLDAALAMHEQRLPVAEMMGDIDSLAHIKCSQAGIRLQRGDWERGGAQAIVEELTEAFGYAQKLRRADFIGGIGFKLGQVLAMGGLHAQALEVLAQAEAAFARLGNQDGLAAVRQVQAAIEQARGA